jgi:uncharacterized protein YacL
VFLLITFVMCYVRVQAPRLLLGALGLLLTFVAAGVQQSSLQIAAIHLDHNALYHIVQAVAMVLLYLGARVAVETAHSARRIGPPRSAEVKLTR